MISAQTSLERGWQTATQTRGSLLKPFTCQGLSRPHWAGRPPPLQLLSPSDDAVLLLGHHMIYRDSCLTTIDDIL